MARMIIRYSLDSDDSTTHTASRLMLQGPPARFDKIGTASFEASDVDRDQLLDVLVDLLQNHLRRPRGGGTLDHLWVYFDEPDATRPAFVMTEDDD